MWDSILGGTLVDIFILDFTLFIFLRNVIFGHHMLIQFEVTSFRSVIKNPSTSLGVLTSNAGK